MADSLQVTERSLAGVIAAWLALVGAGSYAAYRYETAAGAQVAAGPAWPERSVLVRATEGYTIVMFAHPACGCTAASLAELAVVIADAPAPPRIWIVFAGDDAAALEASDNWRAAGRLAGAIRLRDPGHEAHRFGARTSGHVLIYDPRGGLVFSGGITGARGHAGDNAGRRAAQAALDGRPSPPSHAVFGCALEDAS